MDSPPSPLAWSDFWVADFENSAGHSDHDSELLLTEDDFEHVDSPSSVQSLDSLSPSLANRVEKDSGAGTGSADTKDTPESCHSPRPLDIECCKPSGPQNHVWLEPCRCSEHKDKARQKVEIPIRVKPHESNVHTTKEIPRFAQPTYSSYDYQIRPENALLDSVVPVPCTNKVSGEEEARQPVPQPLHHGNTFEPRPRHSSSHHHDLDTSIIEHLVEHALQTRLKAKMANKTESDEWLKSRMLIRLMHLPPDHPFFKSIRNNICSSSDQSCLQRHCEI